jgi:hypothetical protein
LLEGKSIMYYLIAWGIFWGIVGSLGTAFLHQQTGRDVRMGGIIGAAVGAIGGIFFLLGLWIYIYYFMPGPVGRMYGRHRRIWYRWWE